MPKKPAYDASMGMKWNKVKQFSFGRLMQKIDDQLSLFRNPPELVPSPDARDSKHAHGLPRRHSPNCQNRSERSIPLAAQDSLGQPESAKIPAKKQPSKR